MAKDFRISTEQKDGVLHINLSGGFDQACARQVVKLFAANRDGNQRIVVDTSRLDHPDPLALILSEWSRAAKKLVPRPLPIFHQ